MVLHVLLHTVASNYFILCCFHEQKMINVTYTILYEDETCSDDTAPDSVVVSVKKGSTVQTVIEQAVTDFGRFYRFSATYFGGDLGYFIDTINGTTSDNPCFWFLYTSTPTSGEALSPVGVSTATVEKGSAVTWRYESFTVHF